jgi:NADP-dependent 3-hydroxy acid dehydrogenase YdfG
MTEPKAIAITGASSGIGAALALAYAAPGRFLALTGRDQARLKDVAGQAQAAGAEVLHRIVDVADRPAMAAFIAECEGIAPLDLVIANAGVDSWGYEGDERFYRTIDINVNGVLNTILPAIPAMQGRRRGQIAIMSSLAGYRGLPTAPAYCTSKAAVRSLGEALRGQLAGAGVQVSVITPGFVESRITDGSRLPMPFKWKADRAARHIKDRLRRNQGRIAFPWQLYAAVWVLNVMPQWLADIALRKAPARKYD